MVAIYLPLWTIPAALEVVLGVGLLVGALRTRSTRERVRR